MTDRTKRLKSLVLLQGKLTALHEMRHGAHLARAADAARDAADLAARADAASPIAGLFGDLYSKRIGAAINREAASRSEAAREAARIAAETLRGSIVERAWREASGEDERQRTDIERLEVIGRAKPPRA